jgi:hypothetical protein
MYVHVGPALENNGLRHVSVTTSSVSGKLPSVSLYVHDASGALLNCREVQFYRFYILAG